MTKQVSIIGAGVAGLALGQLLRKQQIPTIIWEKSKHYSNLQNFGLTLQSNAYLPLLQALEIDEKVLIKESAIKSLSGQQSASENGALRVNRSELLGLLGQDLDIRWSHKLTELSNDSNAQNRLVFHDEHGQEVVHQTDVVVAADGVHSSVRNELGLSDEAFKLKVLPYVVYNGKRTFPSTSLPTGLEECLRNPHGLTLVRGDTVLKITSGYHDEKSQKVAINYTLSRGAGPGDESMLNRGKTDAETLAKKILEEAAQLQDLKEPFKTVFAPDSMREDRLLHWLMRSAVLDFDAFVKAADRDVFIFGDAANPTPILGGSGACNAMTSVLHLADVLSGKSADRRKMLDTIHTSWIDWKRESEQALQDMHQVHAAKPSM